MELFDSENDKVVETEDIPESELVTFKRDETEYILMEMCKRVGAPYSEELFSEPEWYTLYTWTPEEAAKFTKWVAALLKRRHKGVGVKKSTREAEWFVLNCGWKVSEANGEAPIIE